MYELMFYLFDSCLLLQVTQQRHLVSEQCRHLQGAEQAVEHSGTCLRNWAVSWRKQPKCPVITQRRLVQAPSQRAAIVRHQGRMPNNHHCRAHPVYSTIMTASKKLNSVWCGSYNSAILSSLQDGFYRLRLWCGTILLYCHLCKTASTGWYREVDTFKTTVSCAVIWQVTPFEWHSS